MTDLISGLESLSCFGPLMQNPTGGGHKREVSLMDEEFFVYTKDEVGNLNHEAYYNKTQKEIEILSVKAMKDDQIGLPDLLGNMTDDASDSHVLDTYSQY